MQNILGGGDLVSQATARFQKLEPEDGWLLMYSGGRHADVTRRLLKIAGVKHQIIHHVTGLDAPETMIHISTIPDVIHERPKISFWRQLVKEKFPPTRRIRWCCEHLKERAYPNRFLVTGIMACESVRRSSRSMLETSSCGFMSGQRFFHPLFNWTQSDIDQFIREDRLAINPLYAEGFPRVGCIGCPMATIPQRMEQFRRWPQMRQAWVNGFDKMLLARHEPTKRYPDGIPTPWRNGEEVLQWALAQ
jgi:phosphoadenosine phosphosulfate reductase